MIVDVKIIELNGKAGDAVVIVDVLRSSTAIVTALENGTNSIILCEPLEEAKKVAKKMCPEVLLVGEQDGITPEGFDLNISPHSMVRESV